MEGAPNLLALAIDHHRAGRLTDAEQVCRQILATEPTQAWSWHLLGVIAGQTGRPNVAAECFRRALELLPDFPDAHLNLGLALQAQGMADEAIAFFRRAVSLEPSYAEAHFNLGVALHRQDNLSEAMACYRRALELKPKYAEACSNLGRALHDDGHFDEAAQYYCEALAHSPGYADAHLNQALLMLLTGDFEHGWAEYEWRWKTDQLNPRRFQQPQWDGRTPRGQTILLHLEQGLGDAIQFVRYAALVKELGATVLVQCPKRVTRLLSSCAGIEKLIAEGESLPPFDIHAPLLSLPNAFKTKSHTIPKAVPYLFADPLLAAVWGHRLEHLHGFRIGINWRGGVRQGPLRARDIPIDYFGTLAQAPGAQLVSLQKGAGRQDLVDGQPYLPVFDPGSHVDELHGAFMDTAAIMVNLDLVITCDTAIAHLAGALAVPVWVALPLVPDWRWLLDRPDSPWYPTMRLFRQRTAGDWEGVFQEIQAALHGMITKKNR